MKGLILALLSSTTMSTNLVAENTLYRWLDLDGKIHYSDKPASNSPTNPYSPKQLVTTTFVKAAIPQQVNKRKQRKRTKNVRDSEKNRCKLIAKKIMSLRNKLKLKLPANQFDQYKSQLRQNKWEKMKYC